MRSFRGAALGLLVLLLLDGCGSVRNFRESEFSIQVTREPDRATVTATLRSKSGSSTTDFATGMDGVLAVPKVTVEYDKPFHLLIGADGVRDKIELRGTIGHVSARDEVTLVVVEEGPPDP